MTPEQIKEIRKLVDAATRGPWQSCNGDNFAGSCIEGIHYQNRVDVIVDDGLYDQHKVGVRKREDAIFIAAARTVVPRLLDEVESLRHEFKMLQSGAIRLSAENKVLVERNEKLEADHREMKYPEFEKRTPKERYQVRFWSTRQLYTEFVIRCKDDELLMQDVFQDFMLWFVNRELRVKE